MLRDNRVRAVVWALIGTLLAAIAAAIFISAALMGQVRQTQLDGTPLGRKLQESSDRILDCTQPTGECFKDGQKRQAGALATVQQITILAAACSATVSPDEPLARRIASITKCVNAGLIQP